MLTLFWGLLAGAFLIIELIIPALVSIWFAISAFVVMFIAIFTDSLKIQFFIFICLSIILLISTKKFINKFIRPSKNICDKLLTENTAIVEKIISTNKYEVKYKGVIWSAISEDCDLKIGEEVKIVSYKGNKMIIKKGDE
ncbi:NfeD family protein [Sneathia sanguinegens]|uniref:NfeD family protein n=1 Tax=Sneathia sanguinegens TaxID=40543 RepID=UPI0023F80361|nr:NfeD family protein [Sneathia sanguinegens]